VMIASVVVACVFVIAMAFLVSRRVGFLALRYASVPSLVLPLPNLNPPPPPFLKKSMHSSIAISGSLRGRNSLCRARCFGVVLTSTPNAATWWRRSRIQATGMTRLFSGIVTMM
jgi:hypothetical protein